MQSLEAGQRKIERAELVAIMEFLAIGRRIPLAAAGEPGRARGRRDLAYPVRDPVRIMLGEERNPRLGDARLLGGDDFQPGAQKQLVVESQLGGPAVGGTRSAARPVVGKECFSTGRA